MCTSLMYRPQSSLPRNSHPHFACQETQHPRGTTCSGLHPRQEAELPDTLSPPASQQPSVPAAQPPQWGNPQLLPPTAGMHFPGAWLRQRPQLWSQKPTLKNRTMVWHRRKASCSGAGRKVGPVLKKSGQIVQVQHSWLCVTVPGRLGDTFWVWQVAGSERSQPCPALCCFGYSSLYYKG